MGISRDNPASYSYYMQTNLLNDIDINRDNTHIPNGMCKDIQIECLEYEKLIQSTGGIDLLLLGIGVNGHIGFNEPGTSFETRTHVVELTESTRIVNSGFFPSLEDVPTKAITMGISTIMVAKQIVLLAQGEAKADALRKIVNGEVTEDVPASILQLHPDVTIITDIEV